MSWTKEKIIEALTNFKTVHGRSPKASEMKPFNALPASSTIIRHFGSINEGLNAAGLDSVERDKYKWTEESILTFLKLKTEELGRFPTTREVNADSRGPQSSSITRRLGSWQKAAELIGSEIAPPKSQKPPTVSKEELINFIKEFPDAGVRDAYAIGATQYAITTFGGWNSLKKEANAPLFKFKEETKEEFLQLIEVLAAKKDATFDSVFEEVKRLGKTHMFYTYFENAGTLLETFGLQRQNSLYGSTTKGKDGILYKSKSEAYFCDTYLFTKYNYDVEPSYTNGTKWRYDWYIRELELYIELTSKINPERVLDKIEYCKTNNINCWFIPHTEPYKPIYEKLSDFKKFDVDNLK